jgi:hypothetical protein
VSENGAENSKMAEGTSIITIALIGSSQHLKNGCGRRTSLSTVIEVSIRDVDHCPRGTRIK